MPIRHITIHCSLLLAFVALSFSSDMAHRSQEDDIREALFRYQFEHNASAQQQTAHDYYLAVGEEGADPSDEFMRRFADHKPLVHKASACRIKPSTGEVVNKRNGKPGLRFRQGTITWVSAIEVTVWDGYDEANVSSSGNTYTLKRQNGRWYVTEDKMEVISMNRHNEDGADAAT
jgi:hypothetical protein